MNEEELQWLKEISTTTGISYSGDKTITTDFANKLIDYIKELEQLQNNWNELKKWLEEEHTRNISWYGSLTHHDKQYYLYKFGTTKDVLDNVQDKMQELENK